MALIIRGNRNVWDPFRDLSDLQREMNRVFSGFGRSLAPRRDGDLEVGIWAMPLDVYETKDQLIVKAEMPGFKPEDIELSVLGTTLTVKGERKQESELKEENSYRRELAYGSFQRQIDLPQVVNTDVLKATYKNGILEISLPKREEAKPKQIKVQAQ